MEKRKKTLLKFFICVGLLCIIWGGYLLVEERIRHRISEIGMDDFSWVVQVEQIDNEGEDLILSGFAFRLGEDAKAKSCEFVLLDLETKKMIYPEMKYVEREDVDSYFSCEYDYSLSGFVATLKGAGKDIEGEYEILLKPYWGKKAYKIGTYISGGTLVYANPGEYKPLDVENTEYEEVVKQGVLRVYRPEIGVVVYQYEDALYWFLKKTYQHFGDDQDMWMQYRLYTTQVDKLPKEQVKNNSYWSNHGFSFVSKELTQLEAEQYRVAKCEIPKEHSISVITTGQYKDGWIWEQRFRPLYDFSRNVK